MEKTMVFLPIILFFGFFGVLVGGFVLVVVRLITKSKKAYWKGEVIDKKENTVRDRENPKKLNTFYWLVVKTEQREMKVGLSREMWEKFNIGDMLEKQSGKLFPIKIQ